MATIKVFTKNNYFYYEIDGTQKGGDPSKDVRIEAYAETDNFGIYINGRLDIPGRYPFSDFQDLAGTPFPTKDAFEDWIDNNTGQYGRSTTNGDDTGNSDSTAANQETIIALLNPLSNNSAATTPSQEDISTTTVYAANTYKEIDFSVVEGSATVEYNGNILTYYARNASYPQGYLLEDKGNLLNVEVLITPAVDSVVRILTKQ